MDDMYKNSSKDNFPKIIKDDFDRIKFDSAKQFQKQKDIINKVDKLINLGFKILFCRTFCGWLGINYSKI